MASIIADVLESVQSATSKIDELVRQGKKDELHALHRDMTVQEARLTEFAERSIQALSHSTEERFKIIDNLEEVRLATELLAAEKVCLSNEMARLVQEERRVEHEPMLKHVHHAVLQTTADYHELEGRLYAEYQVTDASLGGIINDLLEWCKEMDALEQTLEEIESARVAVEDVLEKLERAEAELVAGH
ncbi:hypothetical protein PENSPDRAFT_684161 [Peniophora sp. CONT]|nr:hypothetical protein PENSPDRAFT_684161 [Peniophora sp. CONT]